MKVQSTKPKRLGALLKGLKPILEAVSLEYIHVAEMLDITPSHLSRLANLKQGTGQGTIEALCILLHCKEADLLTEPTDLRIAQIVADFDEAKAVKSRARASHMALTKRQEGAA